MLVIITGIKIRIITMRLKCSYSELFSVHIFLNMDQKNYEYWLLSLVLLLVLWLMW